MGSDPMVKKSFSMESAPMVKHVKGSELIDTVVIDTVTPWWTAHMAKESLSRYAPRAWGMQPNIPLLNFLGFSLP